MNINKQISPKHSLTIQEPFKNPNNTRYKTYMHINTFTYFTVEIFMYLIRNRQVE